MHSALAEDRRSKIVFIYNNIDDYDNIVYIGGHLTREYPIGGKNIVYINPNQSASDI